MPPLDTVPSAFDTMHRSFVPTVVLCLTSVTNVVAQQPDPSPPKVVRVSAPVEVEMLNAGTEAAPLPAVSVMINGRGPYRFGIETGAGFLVVSNEVAAAAGLRRTRNEGDVVEYHADSITVGGALIGDVALAALPRMPRGVDGLLGLPAFADLLLTIDYPRRRVLIERDTLPAPDGKTVLPLTRVADFVAVPIAYGTHSLPTIIDTRSTTAFGIEPSTAATFAWKTPPALAGAASGAGIPTSDVSRGTLGDAITLGSYSFMNAPIVVHALPPDFPHEPRMGAGALRNFAFTLDQRTRRARFARSGGATIDLAPAEASAPAGPAPVLTAAKLAEYVGTYGIRTISVRDGKGFLQRTGGQPLELIALRPDEFTLQAAPAARIVFTRDAAGTVIEMAVLAPSGEWERAKRAP